MRKYNIALTDKGAKVTLLQTLLKEYKQHKNQVFANIQEACRAANRLEEIGLGKNILSSIQYIARLIESERRSNRPNKENRLFFTFRFEIKCWFVLHKKPIYLVFGRDKFTCQKIKILINVL